MSDLPEGMRWCPECNGEGEVWTMDATPDMDEHRHACTYPGCAEGKGIVRAEREATDVVAGTPDSAPDDAIGAET